MAENPPSAAEAEWREIVVRIYPHGTGWTSNVFLRLHKGTTLKWQRSLDIHKNTAEDMTGVQTTAEVLTAVALHLMEIAVRAER